MTVDNVAYAIKAQYDFFLQYILKRDPVYVLRKKRSGPRCTVCWDEVNLEVKKSRCTHCYNTSYEGGYDVSAKMYISFTEPGFSTKFDINDSEDFQQNITQAWATGDFLIKSEDVVVDSLGRRFRVVQSQPTTKDGTTYLRQILNLQYIPNTDIIYSFKVPAFPLKFDIQKLGSLTDPTATVFMFDPADLEGEELRYSLNVSSPMYTDDLSTWSSASPGMSLVLTPGSTICFATTMSNKCHYYTIIAS